MTKFIKVAALRDIPPGQTLLVEYDDEEVGLIHQNGQIYAMSNVCTHDNGPLFDGEIDGDCIVCPRHGARFNYKTGHYTLPAFSPAPRYAVKTEGQDIFIAPLDVTTHLYVISTRNEEKSSPFNAYSSIDQEDFSAKNASK